MTNRFDVEQAIRQA
ncbi:hypothetical protein [Escherichia coli]